MRNKGRGNRPVYKQPKSPPTVMDAQSDSPVSDSSKEEGDRVALEQLNVLVKTLVAKQEGSDKNVSESYLIKEKREVRTLQWLAGYTIITGLLLVVSFYQANIAHESMVTEGRAWIAPTGLVMESYYEGHPFRFRFTYQNIGRSPALDVRFQLDGGYADPPTDNRGFHLVTSPNTTCSRLPPINTGEPSYPGIDMTDEDRKYRGLLADSAVFEKPVLVDRDFLIGRHIFYVQGCVEYRTYDMVGRSKFCFGLLLTNQDGTVLNDSNVSNSGKVTDHIFICPGNTAE